MNKEDNNGNGKGGGANINGDVDLNDIRKIRAMD